MKRFVVPAGAAVAAAAAAVPGLAAAQAPTPAHTRAYEHAYHAVAHQLGARVPGRNIIEDGTPAGAASDAETVSSLAVLQRMLAPAGSVSSASSEVGGSGAGAAGVPACASESGDNYSTGADNTNPTSGATGRYQILPSTAAAYGCSLTTPAGQDACAQVIYEHQGAGAWVGCGG
jgi:Transglycosylase-like domain